jgi:hypothetical protein
MAGRRYVRDNRGRFATVGATARGGRLATASGNKRATQTAKIGGGKASGTISKPMGLKPGAIKAKPQVSSARQAAAAKPAPKPKTTKAEKAVAAAQNRLRTKRYGDTASQGQALLWDRRVASMTPRQYAAAQVRSASALVRRNQRSLRDPLNAGAPSSWRKAIESSLATNKKEFKEAAADYRLLSPKPSRKRK